MGCLISTRPKPPSQQESGGPMDQKAVRTTPTTSA
jgi:hypothetical protein